MGLTPTTYTPTSRRPIADVFRRTADAAVRFCVARHIHPDAISYLSIVAAAGAAACYLFAARWPVLLLFAPLLLFLRLWFNMLDGMVALAANKASRRGEIVNELPDRVSDILVFAAVAHSGLANPFVAYWCAILAVMTAYVGTLGQAVTGKRRFEGWMSKQYRMAVLAVGTWVMYGMVVAAKDPPQMAGYLGRFSAIGWALWIVISGCVQTMLVRLVNILRDLRREGSKP